MKLYRVIFIDGTAILIRSPFDNGKTRQQLRKQKYPEIKHCFCIRKSEYEGWLQNFGKQSLEETETL